MGAPLDSTKTFPRDLWGSVLKHLSVRNVARCRVVCKDAQRAGKQTIQDKKPQVVDNFSEAINTDSRPIKDIINDPNYKQKEYFDILHSLSLIERRQASKDIREKLNDDKKEQVDEFLRNVAFTIPKTEHIYLAISCGADVNSTDEYGTTILHNAAKHGYDKIVQALLKEENIDINRARIDGKTALQIAAFSGCAGIVKALIENSAEVSYADAYGNTALHDAARIGCTEAVKTLLKAGADINQVNNEGRTVLQEADFRGHADIVKILKKAERRKKLCDYFSKVMRKMCMMCIPK